MSDVTEHNGYTILSDGYGFYSVFDPYRQGIGSCEGMATAREMIEDHQKKVYSFYRRWSHLAPIELEEASRRVEAKHAASHEERGLYGLG